MQYVQVTDVEDSESIEIPTEDDGSLTVAALAAHYPGATGLKYRLDGHVRAVKLIDDRLIPPEGGWSNIVYYCVFPKDGVKRKGDDAVSEEAPDSKQAKTEGDSKWVHTDLVVLGLPWKTTDKDLNDYFSKYGELQLAQVKVDPITKKSKGYGFIRFNDQEVQVRVMLQRHQIDGRWCDVRIPVSKNFGEPSMVETVDGFIPLLKLCSRNNYKTGPKDDTIGKKSPYKVFVGQCTEDLTEDVLREYFSQFGEISDLYVPKPFRAFAFITFVESNAARNVCAQEHQIKDAKVYVTEAVPKNEDKFSGSGGRGGRGGGFSGGSKRRDFYGNGGGYDNYYGGSGGGRRGGATFSGRRDDWRAPANERWDEGYGGDSASKWRGSAPKTWQRPAPTNPRWREPAPAAQNDPNFDPDVVAAVVNKAVMGVIGNLKGPAGGESNGGGGYGKDDWWSRR